MADSNESLEKVGAKFKEFCLVSNELEIKKALDAYLDPERDLDVSEKSLKLLKSYLSGGINYEKFKAESINF